MAKRIKESDRPFKQSPPKRTAIGKSKRSRPKNKNKRKQYKKYRGQGK